MRTRLALRRTVSDDIKIAAHEALGRSATSTLPRLTTKAYPSPGITNLRDNARRAGRSPHAASDDDLKMNCATSMALAASSGLGMTVLFQGGDWRS
jgi:hypothetical protein